MAIPKEGYFELERGRYGPVFPRTPACYGFSIIAKVNRDREIESLEKVFGKIGSGYPHDEATISFLKNYLHSLYILLRYSLILLSLLYFHL